MQQGYWADKPLGYAQAAAGTFDTAKLVSTLTFGSAGSAGIPKGTTMLIIQPETAAIRLRDDATAPTASVGYPVAVGAEFRYSGNPEALQIIGQAISGVVNVWAFG